MAALRTAEVRPGSSVAVIGLGGVGLSVVMGAALAGAATIVAVDLVPAKLDRARDVGATHTVVASDPDSTREAIREATAGGPEFAFEAVGLASTIETAVSVLPMGGTAVLVGLTRYGERPSFDAFDLVDGSRRIVGSNYGWSIPAVDFPRLAGLYLTGRLPVDRLIDERIRLDGVNAAFDAMRRGEGVRRVIVF
ncbi:MAG: zinc-binding dehydrogenase [Actinobacteria bacterium]|nr:zinc-binding dehydrogenase [Actinomycetota bacterium]